MESYYFFYLIGAVILIIAIVTFLVTVEGISFVRRIPLEVEYAVTGHRGSYTTEAAYRGKSKRRYCFSKFPFMAVLTARQLAYEVYREVCDEEETLTLGRVGPCIICGGYRSPGKETCDNTLCKEALRKARDELTADVIPIHDPINKSYRTKQHH